MSEIPYMPKVPGLSRRAALSMLLASPALAMLSRPAAAETTLQRILRSGRLSLGFHNRAPWGFRGPDGQAAGYHPDLVRAAFGPLGVNQFDFTIAEVPALIPGLVADRFD